PLQQRPVLLQNQGQGRFVDLTGQGGPYFRDVHIGRGVALGDLDNDGWTDLVFSHLNEPAVLLRNEAKVTLAKKHHWLGIELVGQNHRDVVGAKVTVELSNRKLTRFAKGGGSYLSACDKRHLFGLGPLERIDQLTVMWPSGKEQHWKGEQVALDRYHRVV